MLLVPVNSIDGNLVLAFSDLICHSEDTTYKSFLDCTNRWRRGQAWKYSNKEAALLADEKTRFVLEPCCT